jgi:hypothetical protein
MAHAMQRFCSFRTIKASSIHWTSVMPDKSALMCSGHQASLMEKKHVGMGQTYMLVGPICGMNQPFTNHSHKLIIQF